MDSAAVIVSNAVNPVFALLALGAFAACRQRPGIRAWAIGTAVGLTLSVVLTETLKSRQIWPGHPEFPSGHETFGVSVAVSLIVLDRRWAPAVAIMAMALGWALVAAGYHRPSDIAGAIVVAPTVTGLAHALSARLFNRARRSVES